MTSRWADVGGKLHYARWDGPSGGPAFLLVHGLGGNLLNWLPLAPILAERGPVFALDLPGFGRSPLGRRRANLTGMTTVIARFAETVVGEPAVVVGNSMGGFLSLRVAESRPDLARGLVLVAPALPGGASQVDARIAGGFAAVMVPGLGNGLVRARARLRGPEAVMLETLALCTVDPSLVPRDVVDAHLALARERAEMPWAVETFVQATRSLVSALLRRRRFDRMVDAISAPVLLLAGRQDRLVPLARIESLARARPDWDLAVFDHLGHAPQLEGAREVMDAIGAWLDGPASLLLTGKQAQGSP